MARLLLSLAAIATLAPLASAGIKFTSPTAGASLTAGSALDVKWEENNNTPKIADLLTFQLFLCAGGNAAADQIVLVPITTQGSFAAGNAASGMVGVTAGESSPKNAYFIKMIAVAKAGGQLITYSDRFSYSGMTGVFPASIKTGLTSIDGTTGPDTVDSTNNAAGAAQPAAAGYDVAYTMQTGLTRYAPMQPVPPTMITAKNTQPLYPTSSVSTATTRLPIPKIQTTLTQSQTYSVSSRENTVAAASHPTDDMAKFLNRWKD